LLSERDVELALHLVKPDLILDEKVLPGLAKVQNGFLQRVNLGRLGRKGRDEVGARGFEVMCCVEYVRFGGGGLRTELNDLGAEAGELDVFGCESFAESRDSSVFEGLDVSHMQM
jgi:hypothetical protein